MADGFVLWQVPLSPEAMGKIFEPAFALEKAQKTEDGWLHHTGIGWFTDRLSDVAWGKMAVVESTK